MSVRFSFFFLLFCGGLSVAEIPPKEITLTLETHHPIASFDPRAALGAGIDGHWHGESLKMLSPESVQRMFAAGLGPISMRLRTELAIEAWHWNPKGSWSDPQHHQGYWLSDAKPDPASPLLLSYGYKLPRRGTTLDEANDNGYSMLDDGDPSTFWKSNPYLAKPFTGQADSRHPQWVVLDFGKPVPINAIRINWADPYATDFLVEYANKGRVYFGGHPGTIFSRVWKRFPEGKITKGKGGNQMLLLCQHPIQARYLRIWMTAASGTALPGSSDQRDHLGYAIREIEAGVSDEQGAFHDQVSHAASHHQTITYASSTDPWHRLVDRDPKVEQPGIDLLFRCGITRGLPIMLALPVLYDTPENSAALAEYVEHSRYRVLRDEMGEEPDGQRIDPRDFGALYAQTALNVRKVVPGALMGGPSFVTVDVDSKDDKTYRFDKRWWIRDFLNELKQRGQKGDFRFLSFEWYPFDDVDGVEAKQLPKACGMLRHALQLLRSSGMPRVPLIIGEFNYSVFPCQQEVDLAGALLNAETAAQFLSEGGESAYYYGYEPNKLDGSSGSWGNQLMLLQDRGGIVPVATFQAMRLLSSQWLNPKGGLHRAFSTRTNLPLKERNLLSTFALKRPEGSWSLLLINKDQEHPLHLSLKHSAAFNTACTLTTYSATQYHWHSEGPDGYPSRNNLPETRNVSGREAFTIPAWSIAVLNEKK